MLREKLQSSARVCVICGERLRSFQRVAAIGPRADQHVVDARDRLQVLVALAIGDEVRLSITGPCPRCVMTTLPQGDLPRDPDILRTAARHNHVHVGVYAAVVRGGMIRRGDSVRRVA